MAFDDWEAELVEKSMGGDLRAYAVLTKRYQERLFLAAYRILHHREDAQDCVQESFVRAWEGVPNLRTPAAFPTWIYRVLTHQALDALKRRERRLAVETPVDDRVLHLRPTASGSTPREVLRKAREAERIERAIDDLAPKQKVVFVLRHYQGLKLAEIAEVLDAPIGTVKATLHQAMNKLRANLLAPRKSKEAAD